MSTLIGGNRIKDKDQEQLNGVITGSVSSNSEVQFELRPPIDEYWFVEYVSGADLNPASDQGATTGNVVIEIGHIVFGSEYIRLNYDYNQEGRSITGIDQKDANIVEQPNDISNILNADLLHVESQPIRIRVQNKTDVSLDLDQLVNFINFEVVKYE